MNPMGKAPKQEQAMPYQSFRLSVSCAGVGARRGENSALADSDTHGRDKTAAEVGNRAEGHTVGTRKGIGPEQA